MMYCKVVKLNGHHIMSDYSDEDESRFDIELTFVSRNDREPLPQASSSSDDEAEARARRKHSKMLAMEAIRQDQEQPTNDEEIIFGEPQAPDTNDTHCSQEEEYKLWVEREVERLRREIRVQADYDFGVAMAQKRRMMEDRELKQFRQEQEKRHMKYMQKYYHKGAYSVVDDDNERAKELMQRDYTEAVGDDLIDKTLLPESMRVRGELSERPKTKWTNLRNEDTTTAEYRRQMRAFDNT